MDWSTRISWRVLSTNAQLTFLYPPAPNDPEWETALHISWSTDHLLTDGFKGLTGSVIQHKGALFYETCFLKLTQINVPYYYAKCTVLIIMMRKCVPWRSQHYSEEEKKQTGSFEMLNYVEMRYLSWRNGPFVMALTPLSSIVIPPTARSYHYSFPTLSKFQHQF